MKTPENHFVTIIHGFSEDFRFQGLAEKQLSSRKLTDASPDWPAIEREEKIISDQAEPLSQ